MPTSPSFSLYEKVSEPFLKNNKTYIKVKHPTTAKIRDVRWYTDQEAYTLYKTPLPQLPQRFKKILGFSAGPIKIVRNITTLDDELYLLSSKARFSTNFGWYFASTDSIPNDLPQWFSINSVSWNEVAQENGEKLKPLNELKQILSTKFPSSILNKISFPIE